MGLRVRLSSCWPEVSCAWPGLADLGRGVAGYPFQTREWVEAWSETLGRVGHAAPLFAVLEEEEGGAPVAHLPLVRRTRAGFRTVEFMGGPVADYNAPLVRIGAALDRSAADALWAGLLDGPSFDVLLFERTPAELVGGERNPFLAWGSDPCAVSGHEAALDGSWTAWFEDRFSAASRSTLRRKRKNLGAVGPVETRFARDASEALELLEHLLCFKAERMEEAGRACANTLACQTVTDFYRAVTRLDPEQRHVRVCGLTVADRPVAAQWGIEAGGRFINLLTSYAGEEWRRFSPSLLHFCDLFEWCFARGIETFDFGLGDEPYKDRWCDRPVPLYTVARPRTLRGRGLVLARSARQSIRRSAAARRLFGALARFHPRDRGAGR